MTIQTVERRTSPATEGERRNNLTRIYHIAYEPSFKTATLHFWTECNLSCRGCFCRYETSYFNLYRDPVSRVAKKDPESPPARFLTIAEVIHFLEKLKIETVLLMGVEPTLDPEMPAVAEALHDHIGSFNILMTNGVKLANMEHIDLVLFSLKAYSENIHLDYTGKSNKRILDNFIAVSNSGKKIQAISLVVPGCINAREIERVARFIAGVDESIPLTIHAYFPIPNSPWLAATTKDVLEAVKLARKHLVNVPYRTLDLNQVSTPAVRII